MKKSVELTQKLREVQASKARLSATLNGLNGGSETTTEQRAELVRLSNEEAEGLDAINKAEVEERAAAEAAERRADASGETAELRELKGKAQFTDYLSAGIERRSLSGASLEYAQHRKCGGNRFPLDVLAPAPLEERATTSIDPISAPATWLDMLFADAMARHLGITFEGVAPGVRTHPVTTGGADGVQRSKGEAVAAGSWVMGLKELKPKRHSIMNVASQEDMFRVPGLEDALVRQARASIIQSVDSAIFSGDAGAAGTDADIAGLQTEAGTEKTITQANKVKGLDTLKAFVEMVDGKHASALSDVRVVASVGSNVLWGTTALPTPATTGETVAQFLMRAGLSWRTREGIDVATANGDFGAYVGLMRGIEGAGVAAFWSEGEIVRDEFSSAHKGEVRFILSYFWDFALARASNFARLKYVT